MIGHFKKVDQANPVLEPLKTTVFHDPMRNTSMGWEAIHVFNPVVVVKDNKVYVLYRAEDCLDKYDY